MLNKKIILIFLAAFLIRLIALNQSLWLDEAVTANVVRNFRFSQIVNGFSPTDFHPPLYYLFMKLWTNFFGYSEIALRMPSVLFSLLTGYVIYLIGGIWSAAFFLFNPLIVYYSQEARMYMMATFLLTAGLFYFLHMSSSDSIGGSRKIDSRLRGNDKHSIFFGVFISLAFLSFYGSIFLIAAMFIYLLYKKQYKFLIVSLLAFIVSLLTISSLLYQQFINSKIALNNVSNWSLVLGKANLKNLLLIPIKFSIGRISFYPKWLYWVVAGIWTGFVLFTIKTVLNKTVFIKTVFYLLISPLILGFLVSFFIPMLQYFRFIYLIPIMAILLSLNKNTSMYRYIIMIGFVIFSLTYLLLPQFHREDWKSLVRSLPKDKPVYMIKASSDPVIYYLSNLKVNELTFLRQGFGWQSKSAQEIIVIPYTVDIYGFNYKNILSKNGFEQKEAKNFHELSFEIWRRR